MIQAKVIADSKNPQGDRVTTMLVTFPRFILAELNTHRMLSKNSASSRAIPFEKMLHSVKTNPFIPIAWQKDHKGMQGTEYFTDTDVLESLKYDWLHARDAAVTGALRLAQGDHQVELTKQLCNRLLEPFMWHTVIITATDWENMFSLRCPMYELTDLGEHKWFARSKKDFLKRLGNGSDKPDNTNYLWGKPVKDLNDLDWLQHNKGQAEIHMMALAEAMWDALNESTPQQLQAGEWHIPFGDNINLPSPIPIDEGFTLEQGVAIRKVKIATARCARTSYTIVGEEGKLANLDNDIILHDRLSKSGHWSPFEHCAMANNNSKYVGNFKGFIQYRKMFQNENITC
jgi:thymidylate synthase ThyX